MHMYSYKYINIIDTHLIHIYPCAYIHICIPTTDIYIYIMLTPTYI